MDAKALVRLLQRYVNGERKAVNVLRVPTPDEEDQRRLNRERERLIEERGAHVVRIESLLVQIGIHMPIVRNFPEWLENVASRKKTQRQPIEGCRLAIELDAGDGVFRMEKILGNYILDSEL
uniref:Uncharacterized protein n=1 Tax=Candidatus Kentrum sp. TC TaxID=2126339 RepID=A0A450YMJ6_9GAMM|nr:MAG: hypothetical protein BECKTC1821E_GA0114239_10211 [Candidatus Kentron sp. TC]